MDAMREDMKVVKDRVGWRNVICSGKEEEKLKGEEEEALIEGTTICKN